MVKPKEFPIKRAFIEETLPQRNSWRATTFNKPLARHYPSTAESHQTPNVHFDEERRLAQSTGVDLEKVWSRSSVVKEKEISTSSILTKGSLRS